MSFTADQEAMLLESIKLSYAKGSITVEQLEDHLEQALAGNMPEDYFGFVLYADPRLVNWVWH